MSIEDCRNMGAYIKTAAEATPIYLPIGFNYVPYVAPKRSKTTQTIKGSFTQRSHYKRKSTRNYKYIHEYFSKFIRVLW